MQCHGQKLITTRVPIMQTEVRAMSSTKTLDLRGVYPPIPTPFTANEDVDYQKLKLNMDKWNQVGFRGKLKEHWNNLQQIHGIFCLIDVIMCQ